MKLECIVVLFLLSNMMMSYSQKSPLYIEDEIYYYVEKEYVKYYDDNKTQIYLKGMLGRYYAKSCGYDKYGDKKKGEYYNKNCNSATKKLIMEYLNYEIYDKSLSTGIRVEGSRGDFQERYEGEFLIEGAGSSGNWIYYHKNGKIKSIGEMKNLEKSGKWMSYYSNGNKKSEEFYVLTNDYLKKSKLEGQSKWWFNNNSNQLKLVYMNKNNKQLKIESFYSKEGIQLIENGLGTYKIYGDSGLLEFAVPYKNGQRDGVATWYYGNGKVSLRAIYKSGGENHTGLRWEVLEGYDMNGIGLNLGDLKEGNGTWITFDENGQRQSMSTYENGIKVKFEY